MSDPLSSLDLKFLPDWLKESAPANPYANFQGGGGGGRENRDDRRSRGDRGQSRDRRNDAREGQGRDGGRRSPQGGGGRGPQRQQGEGRGGRRDERRPERPVQEQKPVNVRVEFLPESEGAMRIAKQIRQSAKAYPLFATARLFLERPERHMVRITSQDADRPLFQIGDSVISFHRSDVERVAFRQLRDEYYREESVEVEAPKGNYTSVARSRSSGVYLGPTSYHGYQVGVRKLYEERFKNRMSFEQFQREEIEVVTGEQAVADWKTQQSKQTVYFTLKEAEPIQFKTLQEAEQHFQKTYLPGLVKTGQSLKCTGKASRELMDRGITRAIREAFDREMAYPAGLVHGLRHVMEAQNLQVFKHRKRVLYLSAVRPKRADSTQGFSDGPATVLTAVLENPRITRRDLAVKLLGSADAESPEQVEKRTQLAADLHYLIHAGLVIEFSDGHLDLPLAPQVAAQQVAEGEQEKQAEAEGDVLTVNDGDAESASQEIIENSSESSAVEEVAVESQAIESTAEVAEVSTVSQEAAPDSSSEDKA